jgi:hypothetical protein
VTEAALLLAEIRELCERLDCDEMPAPERVRAVLTGARDIASTLEMSQGRELAQALHILADTGKRFTDRIQLQLQGVHQGQKAMKGYGGLRSHRQGQRIRKKA